MKKELYISLHADNLENDEVVFISSSNNPDDSNLKDILSIRTYYLKNKLNDYDLDLLQVKILKSSEWLNDDVLDEFVGIVRDNSDIEIESIVYINHPLSVYPAQMSHTAVILSGQYTKHWRLAYYNELLVVVYGTIPNYTGSLQGVRQLFSLAVLSLRSPRMRHNSLSI